MKGLARLGYEKAKGSSYRKDIIEAQLRGEDVRAGEGRPVNWPIKKGVLWNKPKKKK